MAMWAKRQAATILPRHIALTVIHMQKATSTTIVRAIARAEPALSRECVHAYKRSPTHPPSKFSPPSVDLAPPLLLVFV